MITVTPRPENGALDLSISTVETITAITRTDANGVADVRTLPGVLPWTPSPVQGKKNKILNPSAGSQGTAGWTATEVTMAAQTGTITGRAQKYFRCTITGTSAGNYRQKVEISPRVSAFPGVNYTLSLWGRTSGPTSTGDLAGVIYFMDAAGVQIGPMINTNLVRGDWAELKVTATAPAGTVTALIRVGARTEAGWDVGEFFDFGAVMFGDDAPYVDGDMPATADAYYTWAGTPYASESIPYVPGPPLTLTDFEAGSGAVSYTAGTSTQPVTWDIGAPWLFVPVMPNYSARLESVLDYSAGGDSLGSIHELLGRADPVAVLRGMGTRAGSLQLWCETFPDAVAIVEACRRGEVLMLRQPEHAGMDMYFTATSYRVVPLTVKGEDTRWAVDLGYREIARPTDPLAGALGWTFAALAGTYPTFRTLPKKYATFQALKLNEVKP